MSRIAVIADIHANLPALQAVVADIADQRVDEVLVNGDLVGRGPQGSAVLDEVAELGWRCARGNHEDYLVQFRRAEVPQEWLTTPEWACARWMAAELDDEHVNHIAALPFTVTSELEPQLRLFHGSPTSHSEGLGSWTDEKTLREHLDSIDEAVLVVAHTHRPFQRQLGERLIVNVGSVGMPFNSNPRAQYAIFEGTGREFRATIRQVPYERSDIYDVYESTGFLRSGNATSWLLRVELETARPHLVPFLKWCEVRGHPPGLEHVEEFMALYDSAESMAEFARSIGLA